MKRILLFLVVFPLTGCKSFETPGILTGKSPENKITSPYTKTQIYKSKEYVLSKTPDYELEQHFQKIVEDSYLSASENAGFDGKSFSYLINPQGALYPFSKVEVKCLVWQNLTEVKAQQICNMFFRNIDEKYEVLKKQIR